MVIYIFACGLWWPFQRGVNCIASRFYLWKKIQEDYEYNKLTKERENKKRRLIEKNNRLAQESKNIYIKANKYFMLRRN